MRDGVRGYLGAGYHAVIEGVRFFGHFLPGSHNIACSQKNVFTSVDDAVCKPNIPRSDTLLGQVPSVFWDKAWDARMLMTPM